MNLQALDWVGVWQMPFVAEHLPEVWGDIFYWGEWKEAWEWMLGMLSLLSQGSENKHFCFGSF